MNKHQTAQLNSFQNTQLQIENGTLIWQSHPTFVANVNAFNLAVADIFKYKNIQEVSVSAARVYKQKVREEMAFKSIKIRSAVQNYASDKNDDALFESVNIPESDLLYLNQQKSLSKANVIEKVAREQLASLAPYQVLLADVDDYLASIVAFQDAIPMVNEIIIELKNATKKLKDLCPAARKIVNTQLKLGATQFMMTAPDFYNKLIDSFQINNQPTRFTEFEMTLVDRSTKETLEGVKVTAVSNKGGNMVQFSSPIGEVDFKQFEPDYWNLTFELPGYEPLHKDKLKADLGKKMKLGVVELLKTV